MPTYVALLRGIMPMNPNMRNEKLRTVFESLGFTEVKTVIGSGNVVFRSPETDKQKLQALIEVTLPAKLHFESTTIIRSLDELSALVDARPFGSLEDTPHSKQQVTFLQTAHSFASKLPTPPPGKSYALITATADTLFSTIDLSGDKTPDLMVWLEKNFSKKITTRTWKTVAKIINTMRETTP